ncbi:berberine bridge enzyme-like 8 [Salvia hispanica]|uniref:berberine bridge enzyme-like 8 n=1 Tax=Salvia hispanica TaxID=49212 RepID=UPI002009074F|nr:berberine bridge enzyme-like 8 [Salvia hispanica]
MKNPNTSTFLLLFLISLGSHAASAADEHQDFVECLSQKFNNYSSISSNLYTPSNSSYSSILRFSIQSLRFISDSTPKPAAIVQPEHESQIPPVIHCAKASGLQIRTRSGGHDYEGQSYVAHVPFVILDLIKLNEITVDASEKTAWVGSGATNGALYYAVAQKSPVLGFPAGVSITLGMGGHVSGGGYGMLLRKYGLAADQVIDARIVNVNSTILDRKSMGEHLFWAIRGGGGASFGVITAWKVQLVDVPEKVTVFNIGKTLEQNATQLIHKWQSIAPEFVDDLFLRIIIKPETVRSETQVTNRTIRAIFNAQFLGKIDTLLPLMQKIFPELRLVKEDCTELSWIESVLFFLDFPIAAREKLLNRLQPKVRFFKAKSDYVQKPIPGFGLEGVWRLMLEAVANQSVIIFSPYGGRMAEIPASATPFPHRTGNLYMIQHIIFWDESQSQDSESYISWMGRLYTYFAPFVSSSPRQTYFNYRDLDIGANNPNGETSYEQAGIWGKKYFSDNFDRLVRVKTMVDPHNFFKDEQSIPPVALKI